MRHVNAKYFCITHELNNQFQAKKTFCHVHYSNEFTSKNQRELTTYFTSSSSVLSPQLWYGSTHTGFDLQWNDIFTYTYTRTHGRELQKHTDIHAFSQEIISCIQPIQNLQNDAWCLLKRHGARTWNEPPKVLEGK